MAKLSLEERFWSKVDKQEDGCWLWTGCLVHNGYGQFNLGTQHDCVRVYAHRFAYEDLVEEVPGWMDLDHLCRTRSCVNPDHLEPVTRGENLRRGHLARNGG